ncbi:MAG: 2-hydroxychromene-2-carboxylate isomerase [Betaproteobacteria bacterium]|nr:2-hydroxychromene-2-carboxylate isomerase [Betaproteobacteria bacterium]
MRRVDWYFDFVSPYAYLCLHWLNELPAEIEVGFRPVLFAGLLAHWGQKGPAEIVPKRRYTYRSTHWQAKLLGVPFRYPAAHPFNPLPHLRLAIAAGSTPEAVRRIFEAVWTRGGDAADAAALARLAKELDVDEARLSALEVKDELRRNTEEAAARGVFGVPTFAVDGELFWGSDSIGYLKAFLDEPAFVKNEEIARLDGLPSAATRKPA